MPRSLSVSIAAFLSATTVVVAYQHWHSPQNTMLHGSAPGEEADTMFDDTLGSTHATYRSETLKYALRHPASWVLDDTHTNGDIDILSEPHGSAIITISKRDDPHLCDPWMLEQLTQTLEQAAAYDPTLTQTSYAQIPWKKHWTIMGSGRRERSDGSWYIRTFVVARPEYGGTLNITTQIKSEFETLFGDDVQAILDSLNVTVGEY